MEKKGQILIETWHGSLGLKRFGKDVNSGKAWVKAAELCGKWADYIISNSIFENMVYRDTFWKDTEIKEYGHPRNDIIINPNEEIKTKIKKIICNENGLDYSTKLLLYAPTFRDSYSFKNYNIDFDVVKEKMSEKFGGHWEVLVRYHPTVRKWHAKRNKLQNVIDVTQYNDIQELLLIADIAITDYSSWIYDYVLQKKPGFLYVPDIEDYEDERGFYYPIRETPFQIAIDNNELISNIENFDEEIYCKKVDSFLKDKGCFEQGDASKKVVSLIESIIEGGKK